MFQYNFILSHEEEIAATVLVMLPMMLPPREVSAKECRKKKWKPSISDGRRAFIDLQKVRTRDRFVTLDLYLKIEVTARTHYIMLLFWSR